MNDLNLSLTVVMVEDREINGYTAYFRQFPNIIAEGDTDEEVMQNLIDAVHDVFMQKPISNESVANFKVIEKSINFTTNIHV